MHGNQVHKVADLTTAYGSHRLVYSQIDGMQNESKNLIGDSREEAIIAVGNPLQPSELLPVADLGGVDRWGLP